MRPCWRETGRKKKSTGQLKDAKPSQCPHNGPRDGCLCGRRKVQGDKRIPLTRKRVVGFLKKKGAEVRGHSKPSKKR